MNSKILQHKKHLQNMLNMIEEQEQIEGWCPDENYVKRKEDELIENYSAELATLTNITFVQLEHHFNNAKPLGNIVVNENGVAEPAY